MLRLVELLQMHGESEPEAAGKRRPDDNGPVSSVGVDMLDRRKGGAKLVRIGQRTVDLRRPRAETPLPLDVHAGRLVGADLYRTQYRAQLLARLPVRSQAVTQSR